MKDNFLQKAQQIRLSEQEFKFFKKLQDKINRMRCIVDADRDKILDTIKKSCAGKFKCEFNRIATEDDFIVYEHSLDQTKTNYIVFDKYFRAPPNIVPSGVVFFTK